VTVAVVLGAIPEGVVEMVGVGLFSLAGGGMAAGAMAGVLMGELVDAGLGAGLVSVWFDGADMALDECGF